MLGVEDGVADVTESCDSKRLLSCTTGRDDGMASLGSLLSCLLVFGILNRGLAMMDVYEISDVDVCYELA